MQRRLWIRGLTALALWPLAARALSASTDAPWQADLPHARLQGEGVFRWLGLRIYDAQLWAAHEGQPTSFSTDNEAWQHQRFVLALRYARDISCEQFVQATLDEMQRADLFATTTPQYERWQQAMRQTWQDVKEGDQLCALHLPGQGCRFYDQHRPLGDIADPDFARAFFAIWLHPSTREQRLRRHLLGIS